MTPTNAASPRPTGWVADHMERWTLRQMVRRSEPARALQGELALDPGDPVYPDPWERAIAQAHREIRELIEDGSLEHDEITSGWVQEWAADIYREGRFD